MYVCTVEERARERLSGFFIPSAPVSRVCVCRVDAFRLVCFFLFLLLALRRGGGGGELVSFFFFFFFSPVLLHIRQMQSTTGEIRAVCSRRSLTWPFNNKSFSFGREAVGRATGLFHSLSPLFLFLFLP